MTITEKIDKEYQNDKNLRKDFEKLITIGLIIKHPSGKMTYQFHKDRKAYFPEHFKERIGETFAYRVPSQYLKNVNEHLNPLLWVWTVSQWGGSAYVVKGGKPYDRVVLTNVGNKDGENK